MKKSLSIIIILAAAMTFAGCSKDLRELDKGETALAITANCIENLSELNGASDGASFAWTSGTNKGTGSAISYSVALAKAGSSFENAFVIPIGQGIYSLKYTQSELNDILREELGLMPGVKSQVDVRIIADVADASVQDQNADTTISVVPFDPVSKTLYLIGDATPNGWSADKATEMKQTKVGLFTWTGKMTKGSFKFITTLGSLVPSYNRNASGTEHSLVLRKSFDDPDEQFAITEAGSYTITADLLNLLISVTKGSEPPYDMIYFVGSFTGWSFEEMTKDPTNPFIFRMGRVLDWNGGGEFKFGTKSGDWSNMYHPTEASAPYTWTAVMADDTGDNKWLVPQTDCGKPYKMALDITPGSENLKMSVFVPYAGMYMVGDATPNGWSIDNATPLTAADPYTFTWTGTLNKGELKFTCDKQSDWNGAWFMASEEGKGFAEGTEVITFVDKHITGNGDIDRKWKVNVAGSYTIELNQLTERMTVKKN